MVIIRFTPAQRQQTRLKCLLDSEKFFKLLEWFITYSGHSDFEGVIKPKDCPQPIIIEDDPNNNTVDHETDPSIENIYEGARYYFPSSYKPNTDSGVFNSQEAFATAMINGTTPTILFHGGDFVKGHEILLHSMFSIQFPFGLGGLDMKRPPKISEEECLRHYMNLSLPQFHRQDFILVLLGMYH